MPTETRTDRHGFPIRTCTRCSGKGRLIGYSNVRGGVCFGCSGSGVVYPKGKVGTAVAEFQTALRAAVRPSSSGLEVGDEVTRNWAKGSDCSRPAADAVWRTVAAIEVTDEVCGRAIVGGVEVHRSYYRVITFTDGTSEHVGDLVWCRRGRTVDPAPYLAAATAKPARRKAPAAA